MATAASALTRVALGALLLAGCSSTGSDTETDTNFVGPYCVAGPSADDLVEAGVAAEVCLDHDGIDGGVVLRATGIRDGSDITVTGGQGDTVVFGWDATSAGLLVNGVPQFSTAIDGQIVSSPLRVDGVWADGSAMELDVDW